MVKTKKIICLYGGPGTGKSTTAALLYGKLKQMNYNCEMNREYIKEWCWENRSVLAGDQTYFFAKMSRKERIYIKEGLDFIITDSPLILCQFYGNKYDEFEQKYHVCEFMLQQHSKYIKDQGYQVEHYFLNRIKEYNPAGRYQNEEEAIKFDNEIKDMLDKHNISYKEIDTDDVTIDSILEDLEDII